MPFRDEKPEEILTQANHILGSGQTSLAKYLLIVAGNDFPNLTAQHTPTFFDHLLERINWRRDLHFQTKTTIDTLDYSGSGWNEGSKLVMAAHGPIIRSLHGKEDIPEMLSNLPGILKVKLIRPGILSLEMSPFKAYKDEVTVLNQLCTALEGQDMRGFPLLIICDSADFIAEDWSNFLWIAFTRSNPSHDIYGVGAFTEFKHWGCTGPLVIDARVKPHHAPELIPDPKVVAKIDRLFASGGSLGAFD